MTIPMPEHWAERIAEGTGVDFWWHNGTEGIKVGEKLITTTQAEAYKNACVREAIEASAAIADRQHFGGERGDDLGWTDCAAHIAAEIRALLPSTPA